MSILSVSLTVSLFSALLVQGCHASGPAMVFHLNLTRSNLVLNRVHNELSISGCVNLCFGLLKVQRSSSTRMLMLNWLIIILQIFPLQSVILYTSQSSVTSGSFACGACVGFGCWMLFFDCVFFLRVLSWQHGARNESISRCCQILGSV